VGTLPQELSSLQLTGELVMVQKKRNPQVPDGSSRGIKKKRMLPHRPMQDRERGAHSGESCTGTDVDTGGSSSSRTRRPLSPGGTHQDAQSQVKRTKQKQKETPYNSWRLPDIGGFHSTLVRNNWGLLGDGLWAHLRSGSMKDNFASTETNELTA